MVISGSFLKIENDKKALEKFSSVLPQIHFDVMDGKFTKNKTINPETFEFKDKKIDVHLMVFDVKKYVDIVSKFNPEYITFHIETGSTTQNIDYIKSKNYKVGIAVNPSTDLKKIYPYLDKVDLILIMSVEAGSGGQPFIDISSRIDELYNYREKNNLNFLIEVDGGINDKTISKVKKADICVVGSFITDSDNYQNQIDILRRILDE